MDAITLLHTRNSAAHLSAPAPAGDVLEDILQAALRAPDHARLRPWRFLLIRGEARHRLGDLFVSAAGQRSARAGQPLPDQEQRARLKAKALRAPLVIAVIARITEHPKVPAVEQILSAGCAAHSILLAAHALGYGGIWRTGANAYDDTVGRGLGLSASEQIVGYLYLGTVVGDYKPLPALASEDFCENWGE